MATTPEVQKFFNESLPAGLKKFPDKVEDLNVKYLFKLSGEGGGTWSVDASGSAPKVEADDSGNAECTIKISADDFRSILKDPNASTQLFFGGKMVVEGNQMLVMKLHQLIDLARA